MAIKRGLGFRIILLLAVSLGFGFCTSGYLMVRVGTVSGRYQEILSHEVHMQDQARQMQVAFKVQVQEWKNILIRGRDPEALAKYTASYREEERRVDALAADLLSRVEDPKARELVESFMAAHKEMSSAYGAALADFTAGGGQNMSGADAAVKGRDRAPTETVDRIVESIGAQVTSEAARMRSEVARDQKAAGAIALVLMVFVLTWGVWTTRRMTRPLLAMAQAAERIAKGDLDQEVTYRGADETGQLAEAFRSTLDYLKGVSKALTNVAAGDLSSDLKVRSEKDDLTRNLQRMTEVLNSLTGEMNTLSAAAIDGRLTTRSDASRYQGAYRQILLGVNGTLDAVITPLNMASSYIDRISNKDIPPRITETYNGDFSKVKDNLNILIDAINSVVGDVKDVVDEALAGNLGNRAEVGRHRGGFRQIVEGLNNTLDAMVAPLNEAAFIMEKVANRDLTARMTGSYRGDLAKFQDSINTAVNNLDEGLQQVAGAVEQVASAAGQIGTGSQSLAQGASEQASSLEEVSSSLQEMSAMTKANTGSAVQGRSMADGARSAATQGLESMSRLNEAMERIKTSSDSTGKIVKTIDEIAFQTNLLALNAAVEAARAGDSGKGFAVVAEEVRNLAMRSAEAAKNTAGMIEESVQNAQTGVALNREVLVKLREINEQAGRVGEVMAEIAQGSEQQTRGIDQVATAVQQVDQVTQLNAANSEQSAAAAEQMSGQAEELRSLVGQFQLGGQSGLRRGHMPARDRARSNPVLEVVGGRPGPRPRKSTSQDPAAVIPFHDDEDQAVLGSF